MKDETSDTCQLKVAEMCDQVLPSRFEERRHGRRRERETSSDVQLCEPRESEREREEREREKLLFPATKPKKTLEQQLGANKGELNHFHFHFLFKISVGIFSSFLYIPFNFFNFSSKFVRFRVLLFAGETLETFRLGGGTTQFRVFNFSFPGCQRNVGCQIQKRAGLLRKYLISFC